jgi:hypothetical protein
LGLGGGEPQLIDDCGEEEREGVERQRHSMKPHSIEPTFVVLECRIDVRPREFLIICCVAVVLQAGLDESSLRLGQEWSRGGIIMDEKVGSK